MTLGARDRRCRWRWRDHRWSGGVLSAGPISAGPISRLHRLHRLALVIALTLLVGCDHATKRLAKGELEGRGPRSLIHGVLDLRYIENTDVAFNLLRAVPERVRVPFLVVTGGAAVIGLLAVLLLRRGSPRFGRGALLLITAGAVGNYLDRIVRGYVVDFVHVPHWPVFNVADAYVTVGAILLAWSALNARRERGLREPAG